MQIRKLEDGEKKETRRLYEEVFPEDSASFVDYYYTEKTKDNTIYAAEEDGAIQAMLPPQSLHAACEREGGAGPTTSWPWPPGRRTGSGGIWPRFLSGLSRICTGQGSPSPS